ncbi:MAG: rhamnulokinase [Sarcina sp.]
MAFLAFDFGASSGRAIIGDIKIDINNKKSMEFKEIHRFSNNPIFMGKKYYWDFPRLFHEMKEAIKKVVKIGIKIDSIGIDTWGVDYGFLNKQNELVGLPMHYREEQNIQAMNNFSKENDLLDLYLETGIYNNSFNTIFQLFRDKNERKDNYEVAKSLLFMPDLFAYYLTGEQKNEYSIASTSGLLDTENKIWDWNLIERLNLKKDIFNEIIFPGEYYGILTQEISQELGVERVPVIAVCGHDTASAVVGTPFDGENNTFLSSGTWSLLGCELNKPIKTKDSYNAFLTNEGGINGSIRFLKNINGTWLLQELKKKWSQEFSEVTFLEIIHEAKKYEDKKFIIDTNLDEFITTKNIITTIKKYCSENGQGEVKELGELAIAIYNGLVKEYANTIKELEKLTTKKIDCINIVGGGIQDEFLCKLTAKATKKKIIAGPIEAAVMGNIGIQALASGEFKSIKEIKDAIKNSFECKIYEILEGEV